LNVDNVIRGVAVLFENGRWWRRGYNHATLINPEVPFMVTIGVTTPTLVDFTHYAEPPWVCR
jgi:hypothetical protein